MPGSDRPGPGTDLNAGAPALQFAWSSDSTKLVFSQSEERVVDDGSGDTRTRLLTVDRWLTKPPSEIVAQFAGGLVCPIEWQRLPS